MDLQLYTFVLGLTNAPVWALSFLGSGKSHNLLRPVFSPEKKGFNVNCLLITAGEKMK